MSMGPSRTEALEVPMPIDLKSWIVDVIRSLPAALRSLEEDISLSRRVAERARQYKLPELAAEYEMRAQDAIRSLSKFLRPGPLS